MNNKERNKAVWRLVLQRIHTEKVLLCVLTSSVIYALVSNYFTHCSPIGFSPNVLDIMASIDETLRNCCYGVIAGIAFYLVNDLYKNAYKKVDLYNAMYPILYNLWLKTYQLILAINNHELDKTHSNDELLLSIMSNLCKQLEEGTLHRLNLEIPADEFHVLYILWSDVLKDKDKFLEIYGHTIEREEYSKLNDKELDISIERLKEYAPNDEQIAKAKMIKIGNYDIQRAIYLMLNYKSDLASMVNKYSIFYYGNQRGIRKDAF